MYNVERIFCFSVYKCTSTTAFHCHWRKSLCWEFDSTALANCYFWWLNFFENSFFTKINKTSKNNESSRFESQIFDFIGRLSSIGGEISSCVPNRLLYCDGVTDFGSCGWCLVHCHFSNNRFEWCFICRFPYIRIQYVDIQLIGGLYLSRWYGCYFSNTPANLRSMWGENMDFLNNTFLVVFFAFTKLAHIFCRSYRRFIEHFVYCEWEMSMDNNKFYAISNARLLFGIDFIGPTQCIVWIYRNWFDCNRIPLCSLQIHVCTKKNSSLR